MSHLTCNKAERITCSLPLTVRLLPQGVPISFHTVHFSKSSAAHVGIFPRRGRVRVALLLQLHSSKNTLTPNWWAYSRWMPGF